MPHDLFKRSDNFDIMADFDQAIDNARFESVLDPQVCAVFTPGSSQQSTGRRDSRLELLPKVRMSIEHHCLRLGLTVSSHLDVSGLPRRQAGEVEYDLPADLQHFFSDQTVSPTRIPVPIRSNPTGAVERRLSGPILTRGGPAQICTGPAVKMKLL